MKNMKQNLDGSANGIIETPIELNCIECQPIMRLWERNCPKCRKILKYKSKYLRDVAHRKISNCKSCGRMGINKGRKHSDATKLNMSRSQKGRKHSEETKEKMRGENNGMYGTYRIKENNPFYGRKHTLESRRKMRLSTINKKMQRNKLGQIANVNPKETDYFKKMESEFGWNGIFYGKQDKQMHLDDLGYFPDYYEPNLNIVVEYDEPRHYIQSNLREKDIIRMNEIKDHLKCKFYRYNEKTDELKEW